MLISRIQECIRRRKEEISYLFFGVLTTIVNFSSFAILRACWGDEWIHVVNVATFVIATLFAYVTNKLFVFESRSWAWNVVVKECGLFFASRISTFAIEALGLFLCVDILRVGKYSVWIVDGTLAAKILLSFVAVLLNYFLSKFIVFYKGTGGRKEK